MKSTKLSLAALKERAEAVASNELLESISGGIEDKCHDTKFNDVPTPDWTKLLAKKI